MYESTRNNKTVFGFAVRDTAAAWQVVQKYMNDKYFRPHEEFRDLYYTTAPGLGMQYLQFFKTESEIQVVTFLGGPVHPVPLSEMQPQTAESVRIALKGMLEPLRDMESQEAAAAQPAPEAPVQPAPEAPAEAPTPQAAQPAPEVPVQPEAPAAESTAAPAAQPAPEAPAQPAPEAPAQQSWYTRQEPLPTQIPQTPDAGFVSGQAPKAQPTANEYAAGGPQASSQQANPQQATFTYGASQQSQPLPQDPYGTRYTYDPVNGGPNDRASNATAGLVLGIIGLLMAFLGMGLPTLGLVGLIPLAIGLILSVNGRHSRRRGVATAGLIICLAGIAVVIFATIVWIDILAG
jgi:outer membrane biosynthesis protein TonB